MSIEIIEEVILELLDLEELTTWEYDFINSMCDFEEFSIKQENKILEIYKNHFNFEE